MKYLCVFLLLVLSISSFTQQLDLRSLEAFRTTESIKVDGILDDPIWKTAPKASDFIQNGPNPGAKSAQQTIVQVAYDNTAIYIAATCFDVSKDSILMQLSNRDEEENTDVFCVFLDTYNDDQNAYGFVVHPTGVQWDARYSSNGQDVSWDAVWLSKTTIDSTNWYVEMKIPFSAIRFSDKEEQVWGVNFARKIRRTREFSFWNPTLPNVDGLVRQFGDLTGITGIKSPIRLAFIPYVSSAAQYYYSPSNGSPQSDYSLRGGMDLKYGINDAFTLDLTLIPDFGQVQSDNQVLNLSPFEVFFQERRPFFMEGTELFNKSDLFYSRRIGGRPINYYEVYNDLSENDIILSNPSEVQLLNSTKVSGRTQSKLGVGILNSVTANTYAYVQKENGQVETIKTAPLTNYNIFVVDQALKNNSFVAITNTNVLRQGEVYDANVTGLNFDLRNKKNSYSINGDGAVSQIFASNTPNLGHMYSIAFRKIGGNFNFQVSYDENSDTYNQQDFGFQTWSNFRSYDAECSYSTFKPKGIFNNTSNGITFTYLRLYNPGRFINVSINTNHYATFKNFFSSGLWSSTEPVATRDFFETRDFNRYYLNPDNYNFGGWFSSDYRKRFALDGRTNFRKFNEKDRYRFNFGLSPRFRVNDHISFVVDFNSYNFPNNIGWANTLDDAIIFSKRNEHIVENSLTGNYIFTNRMGLKFRVRHYWATAEYTEFFELGEDGKLYNTSYDGLDENGKNTHNVNFNAFNVDVIYTWVFAPGSQLNITYKNSILSRNSNIERDYLNNFNRMLGEGQSNSINIKFLYYLDYLSLRKRTS